MRHLSSAALGTLAAAFALSIGAATANASNGFELRALTGELGRFRATAAALTFTDIERTGRVICEVTLALTVNRTIAKVESAQVGSVTSVELANCRGGTVTVASETLPWSVRYVSFTGALPLIEAIRMRLVGATFLLGEAFGAFTQCQYRGNPEGVSQVSAEHLISSIVADESVEIPLERALEVEPCPEEGRFRGVLQTSPVTEVRLI